jgi:protein-L-isoaspartate(D-aspartate) O-methyltransferase
MNEDDLYAVERQQMVQEQMEARDIQDPLVLRAMEKTPRHLFVPPEHRRMAYSDGPLPIGHDQTISQPYIVALMTQLLELKGGERVLEIGTGSGYQAAVLAHIAREVHSVERFPDLAERAERFLRALGYHNVHVHSGDGTLGWPPFAPYQAIIVTAAAPHAPQPLLDQLGEGGQLVVPVGGRGQQRLERWTRQGEEFEVEHLAPVAFVPLLGRYGWPEE